MPPRSKNSGPDPDEENKEAMPGPKSPPLPRPPNLHLESVSLVDIPCVYLNDKSCWSDFKRSLTECGLIWNLSEWSTTIVYGGIEWKSIRDQGTDLSQYFPIVEKNHPGTLASHASNSVIILNWPRLNHIDGTACGAALTIASGCTDRK